MKKVFYRNNVNRFLLLTLHFQGEKIIILAYTTKSDVFFSEKKTNIRANAKVSTTQRGGGTAILTNVFLEQMRNIMENLSNKKVFKVTKGCLKIWRAQKIKVDFCSN